MSVNDRGSGGFDGRDGPTLTTLDERAEMTEEIHDTAAEIANLESVPLPDDIDVSNRIVVEHLNIYYSEFLAVEDVNMIIEPRSVTALIGPSGCGKSTFLRTLNRMHEVIAGARAEGTVLLDGEDLYDSRVDPVAVRRRVGMVFQRPNPFPTMSIYDNVLAGKRLNSKRLKKADADALVEQSLRGSNLWEEVKDRLSRPGLRASRAVSSSACASPGRSPSSPRCC